MSVVRQGELNIQRALQCSLRLPGKRGWFGEDGGEMFVFVRIDPAL